MDPEPSTISAPTVEGPTLDIELSMIQALTVEGPALDIEPSTISTSSVEGSTHGSRTIRDTWHQPWKVQPLNPEPSAPKPQTVEGSRRASNRALPQKRKRPASLPISHFSSYFGTD